MDQSKKAKLTQILTDVSNLNAVYEAQKSLQVTLADNYRKDAPDIAALLEQHEEATYKIRQEIIQRITALPEFRRLAVN